jgi:hypothetical protein
VAKGVSTGLKRLKEDKIGEFGEMQRKKWEKRGTVRKVAKQSTAGAEGRRGNICILRGKEIGL